MNVSACLVTRGNVDMQPIFDSIPAEWQKVIWVNGECVRTFAPGEPWTASERDEDGWWHDLSVYGRYAAIEHASHDLIYVQDDDVIVSDPQAIVDAYPWEQMQDWPDGAAYLVSANAVVCNMPQEFRPHYPDSALVGFGACFHRDAPQRAWDRMTEANIPYTTNLRHEFLRECDRVFTVLTPRVLVDVAKTDMPYAFDPDRLWRQPEHVGSTQRMTELARKVRDA